MRRIFAVLATLVFSSFSFCYASFQLPEGFVSVIDINGTAILYDTSTGKDILAARNQVIASQLRVVKGGVTVEQHIKAVAKNKDQTHEYYRSLGDHMVFWQGKGILSLEEFNKYSLLQKEADAALAEAKQYNDLFPSVIHYIKTLLAHDPKAKFILHSFGHDTAHALAAMAKAIPELAVHKQQALFNEEGDLVLGDLIYTDPSLLKSLVKPGLNIWQANHVGWKNKSGGKVVWAGSSILFDDNADTCSRPIVEDEFNLGAAGDMMGREIQVVDTYQALVDREYFIKLLQRAYPKEAE